MKQEVKNKEKIKSKDWSQVTNIQQREFSGKTQKRREKGVKLPKKQQKKNFEKLYLKKNS